MAKKRRKASPAQLKALAKGRAKMAAKRARKAAPSRPKARRKKALSAGKHRPVVIRKRHKLYRPKRSSIAKHARFANPFLGGIVTMGNPRRRKSHKKSHRRSHRRSRGMRLFSNPMAGVMAAPKQMMSKSYIVEAASVGAGFLLPNAVLSRLPANWRNSTVKAYASKVAVVAVLSTVAGKISKRAGQAILLGGGVSLLLDVYADFIAPKIASMGAGAAAAPAAGVSTFYGGQDQGVNTFYGDSAMSGLSGAGDSIGEAFAGAGY